MRICIQIGLFIIKEFALDILIDKIDFDTNFFDLENKIIFIQSLFLMIQNENLK